MKRDLTKPEADDVAAFSLPALFGKGMDAAKEGFAKFPGPFFPGPFFPGAFAKDMFAKDLATKDLDAKDLDARDLATKDLDLPVKGPRPEAGKPIFFPGALPAASQKLVTDFRAYSGIRHREAVPFGEPVVLGRLGALEVRLARTAGDVRRAQRLRYKVFYEEMSALPDTASRLARRDFDAFDAVCEHILVLDHDAGKIVLGRRKPKVVGTYRLLRQEVANRHGGFYTASEFDVRRVVDGHPSLKFLELGRSCVLKPYRNKRTVELLWHGIWAYVLRNKIDAMLGCASLEGTDPDALALPLSFLHHNALAPEEWRGRALPGRYVEMNRMAKDAINPKAALQSLPPLVKGYLRLGGFVGEGAVTDHQFGTTDVLVVLPVSVISPRYVEHFGPTANRHAI